MGLIIQTCVAIVLLVTSGTPTGAANISCAETYAEYFAKQTAKTNWDERASNLWPSGARPMASSCRVGWISGEITKGDYEKFVAFYKQHHPFMQEVALICRVEQ
jgi:hypothetical protein